MAKKTATKVSPVNFIATATVAAVLTRREACAAIRASLRQEEAELSAAEKALTAALHNGGVVDPSSPWNAALVEEPGRCSPKWKELYLAHRATEGLTAEQAENEGRDATAIPMVTKLTISTR